MIAYIIVLWVASLLLGYTLAFNGATLTIGKSISTTNSPRGFQDAITPPWATNVALLSYVVSIGVIVYGWYEYEWLTGVGITFGFFFLIPLNKVIILPKSESEYFRRLIVHSMMNRYADFVKSGDRMRADAMASLLEKMGIPIPDFNKK